MSELFTDALLQSMNEMLVSPDTDVLSPRALAKGSICDVRHAAFARRQERRTVEKLMRMDSSRTTSSFRIRTSYSNPVFEQEASIEASTSNASQHDMLRTTDDVVVVAGCLDTPIVTQPAKEELQPITEDPETSAVEHEEVIESAVSKASHDCDMPHGLKPASTSLNSPADGNLQLMASSADGMHSDEDAPLFSTESMHAVAATNNLTANPVFQDAQHSAIDGNNAAKDYSTELCWKRVDIENVDNGHSVPPSEDNTPRSGLLYAALVMGTPQNFTELDKGEIEATEIVCGRCPEAPRVVTGETVDSTVPAESLDCEEPPLFLMFALSMESLPSVDRAHHEASPPSSNSVGSEKFLNMIDGMAYEDVSKEETRMRSEAHGSSMPVARPPVVPDINSPTQERAQILPPVAECCAETAEAAQVHERLSPLTDDLEDTQEAVVHAVAEPLGFALDVDAASCSEEESADVAVALELHVRLVPHLRPTVRLAVDGVLQPIMEDVELDVMADDITNSVLADVVFAIAASSSGEEGIRVAVPGLVRDIVADIEVEEAADDVTDAPVVDVVFHSGEVSCSGEEGVRLAVDEALEELVEDTELYSLADDITDDLVGDVVLDIAEDDAAAAAAANVAPPAAASANATTSAGVAEMKVLRGAVGDAMGGILKGVVLDTVVDEIIDGLVEEAGADFEELIARRNAQADIIMRGCNLQLLLSPLQHNMAAWMQRMCV